MTRTMLVVGGKQLDHVELSRYLLELAGSAVPRVLLLPTASGDSADYVDRFYAAFRQVDCVPEHLPMFVRPDDVLTPIASADVIVVGGGNTKNLLLIWRHHGIDVAVRAAYERGAVLSGWSAGCICWFEDGVTDSYGPTLRPLEDGLGWLKGSACPHYDGEESRRPTYLAAVKDQRMPPGYAIDDGVGLLFRNEAFAGAVSPRPEGRAFFVGPAGEEAIPIKLIR